MGRKYSEEQYNSLACRYMDCKQDIYMLIINYEDEPEKLIELIDRVKEYTKKVGYSAMIKRCEYLEKWHNESENYRIKLYYYPEIAKRFNLLLHKRKFGLYDITDKDGYCVDSYKYLKIVGGV